MCDIIICDTLEVPVTEPLEVPVAELLSLPVCEELDVPVTEPLGVSVFIYCIYLGFTGVTFKYPFPATPEPPGTFAPAKRGFVYFVKRVNGLLVLVEKEGKKLYNPVVVTMG